MQLKATLLTTLAVACLQGGLSAQTYTDNFDTSHDYLTEGVTNTIWDGFFYNVNAGGNAVVTVADANLSTNGSLSLRSSFGNWENGDDDGLLLYKTITGGFDARIQVVSMNAPDWHDVGLMARVANLADAGDGEDWVAVKYFANQNNNSHRSTDNGTSATTTAGGAAQPWVRLKRVGDIFTSYRSPDGTNWSQIASTTRLDMSGLPVQVGIWQATFSGNEGVAQLDNFKLTLLTGPAITAQPQPTKSLVGGSASFSVGATGIEPLEYQWLHAGTNLPGAIEVTLLLTNVQTADAGLYGVVTTDADGSTTSDDAMLEVFSGRQLFGDNFSTAHDYTSGDVSGTMWDGLLNAANLDAGSDTTGGVLHLRNTGEGWEAPTDADGPFLYKVVSNNFIVEVEVPFTQDVAWSDGGLMVRVPDLASAGPGEDWLSLMLSGCCGSGNKLRWADDNVSGNNNFTSGRTFLRLERQGNTFRAYTKANRGDAWELGATLSRPDFAGLPLQVGLQHGTFNDANAADRQYDNFWLYAAAGPVITVPPAGLVAVAGDRVNFSVTATGIEPLTYQWLHAGTNLPDAVASTLDFASVKLGDAGTYTVTVRDANGEATSDPAVLTVLASMGTLSDNFDLPHDYSGGNVAGTIWDGFFVNANSGNATVAAADASTSNPGQLTLRSVNGNWENGDNDGLLLYKTVAGDFDAKVRIVNMNTVGWHDAGIMARVASLADAGAGEDWVAVKYFANGNSNGHRSTDDGVSSTITAAGAPEPWVRLVRTGNVFTSYRSMDGTNWTQIGSSTRADMNGLSVQVGIWQATFSANEGAAQLDDFSLSGPGILGAVRSSRENGQFLLSWPGRGFILQQNSDLANPTGWTDVLGVSGSSATLPMESRQEFFRLRTP
jgi:regulation of enolase protein 1 (concanavalin A-like superfamily)